MTSSISTVATAVGDVLSTTSSSTTTDGEITFGIGSDLTWGSQSVPLERHQQTIAELIESIIYTKLVPVVCAFGIAGNLLSLIVLSRKSLTYTMERMEKSAHCGLMALAVSDLLFCIAALPNAFYGVGQADGGGKFVHDSFDFRLAYKLYGIAVVNTFQLTSTWLTVTMAASRYLAICHPLRARQFIGKRYTAGSLISVFVVCPLFNIPRFFRDELRTIQEPLSSPVLYFAFPGPLRNNRMVERAYYWTYFVLGIAVPLAILIFCNAHLAGALRRSLLMRAESGNGGSFRCSSVRGVNDVKSSGHQTSSTDLKSRSFVARRSVRVGARGERAATRLTQTLVIIVIMYVVLFVPAELLHFFSDQVTGSGDWGAFYNAALAIGNLLQAVNFAVNFVLYCAVNTHFRQTICRLVVCHATTRHRSTVIGNTFFECRGDGMTVSPTLIVSAVEEIRGGNCHRSPISSSPERNEMISLKRCSSTGRRD